jgi:hypothetical protein
MQISHLIVVLLLSCVKFFLAIPLAVTYDFSFWQTFILCCLGGIIGVLFFAYFRKVILNYYYKLFPNKKKKKSNRGFKDNIAIATARKYGLFGIAFLTPIFFSIPLGTFIALHFFPNKKKTLPVLLASVLGWSFILTLVWNINV